MRGTEVIAIALGSGRECVAKIRRFKNGRRFRATLRPGGVVAISMPAAARKRDLEEFLLGIRPWLLESLAQTNFGEIPLPEQIHSPLHGLVFRVETLTGDSPRAFGQDGRLVLQGQNPLERLCALQGFFRSAAREFLPTMLHRCTLQPLPLNVAIRIGNQRCAMGSCRIRKNQDGKKPAAIISINWRAAFLSLPMLRHLWLHEIAHLSHPNHSRDFYACLEKLSPQARLREKELTAAWLALPPWLRYHD